MQEEIIDIKESFPTALLDLLNPAVFEAAAHTF